VAVDIRVVMPASASVEPAAVQSPIAVTAEDNQPPGTGFCGRNWDKLPVGFGLGGTQSTAAAAPLVFRY
jgi:hypothetical protein